MKSSRRRWLRNMSFPIASSYPHYTIPIPIKPKETYFSWGDYEHSWVTIYVEVLSTKKVVNVGSLAFPGKKIQMKGHITSFLEQYKYFIDFAQRPRDLEGLNVIRYDKLDIIEQADPSKLN
ncbi:MULTISPECIES: hypothetical protein [Sphingobacterium]|uniref:hypothetical protein n=1 Tax=Sphingobacterium TaxID=28453 RepID=UPI000E063DE2|nr:MULTISPECIES: hypothetical protein [Sphingobacterium]QQT46794.1 hypothetical protein I6J00_09115 [Sphingobacterium multivorum]SUJ89000.1 Uncharacterised protein [Sphingobacterium multivorum]